MEDKGVPRAGYTVRTAGGTEIGTVTTGGFSPSLGTGIALVSSMPPIAMKRCSTSTFTVRSAGQNA